MEEDKRFYNLIISVIIVWIAIIFMIMLSSCKILTGYPQRALMTMEPVAETIAIDPKRGIVYVIFRCEEPPSKMECGMMVQLSLEKYGKTYLGELRPL
jgi:hypothetical protein